MTSTHQRAAQMLAAAADLLDQGQVINRLSLAVTVVGLAVLLIPMVPTSEATQPTAVIVAVLGLIEIFLAMRVALSAAQFRRLANDGATERLDVAAFDAALIALKITTQKKAGRTIAKRFAIARRFWLAQTVVFVLQALTAMVGGSAAYFNGI